ncbi:unnamed protein product [Caenorhabditis angaria]|uniref:Uncharacterized protein n=1 Tax=Caenorhabditis angaria TaxID=860376 RepID=A0A9P1MSK8_9PELO|nr:unnamed protein product [Caenorhabditis angaria]
MNIPQCFLVGRRNKFVMKTEKTNLFCDFFKAFSYVVLRKCSKNEELQKKHHKFEKFKYKICTDSEFIKHVEECCEKAKWHVIYGMLAIFEVCMIKSNEEQIVSFRIAISYNESEEQDERLKMCRVLESIENFELPQETKIRLNTSKFRPRIRLLTKHSTESSEFDYSDLISNISIPLTDSFFTSKTKLSFFVCN